MGSSPIPWLVLALIVSWLVTAGLAGALRRARRAGRQALEERVWLLEKERETAAQIAVDAERARIARELHDIVSHNVSMMLIQAGAARQVLTAASSASARGAAGEAATAAADPGVSGQAEGALLAVETAGRATMTELRHLLGVLAPAQDGSEDGALTPQPSMARLSPLIDRIAFAGLPVEMRIAGEPRPLPAGIDATAYRVIQEALTNALKHGDGGTAEVTVRYDDRYLRIEVLTARGTDTVSPIGPEPGTAASDSPSSPPPSRGDGTGRGLIGLRERVAVYGGDLDARRRLGGGFRVRARIPLDAQ